jgi:diketogulonate reductase-like aldo/keto reductase
MSPLASTFQLQEYSIPRFFYGTAWKEDETPRLTYQALHAGFRAIDTANQRKHYFEEGVGVGIRKFLEAKTLNRSELFLQTKFTYARGQDHRKPYNDKDSFTKQVGDSAASSLKHLGTDHLDSYVLHGPYSNQEIGDEDLETWAAMENLVQSKRVRWLGVSNISASQLADFCQRIKMKPTFVQNRCYAQLGWDKEVRDVCLREGILYQGFSLLTANQRELASPLISGMAQMYDKTVPQIIFRFCQQLGMICLTGTNSPLHMKQDLDIYDFEITPQEMNLIENISYNT